MSSQADKYKSQGNTALAAKMFGEAVDLYTKARCPAYTLTYLLCTPRPLRDSEPTCHPPIRLQAISLDPDSAVYFSNRSAAYAAMDRWREALDDANEATQLQPSWVKGYIRKGGALTHMGQHEEARKAYLKASQLEPHNEQVAALLEQAAAAAVKAVEEGKDWDKDLWSDDEADADAGGAKPPPAAGGGAGASSSGGGGSAGAQSAVSDQRPAPRAPAKRAGAKLVHDLERSLADASAETMRSAMRALGQADGALAQKMLHMLEGLNAASSEGEGEEDESGDEAEPQAAQRKRRRDEYFGAPGGGGAAAGAGGGGGAAKRERKGKGRGGSDSDD